MAGTEPASWPRRMQICNGLKALRERGSLNRQEVAALARVSPATVTRYEDWRQHDQRLVPRTVQALCQACNASPEETRTS